MKTKLVSFILASILSLTILATPAFAADLPPCPEGYEYIHIGKYAEMRKLSGGMAAVGSGEKLTGYWGFVSANGQVIIPPKYAGISSYPEGIIAVLAYTPSGMSDPYNEDSFYMTYVDNTGREFFTDDKYGRKSWLEPFSGGLGRITSVRKVNGQTVGYGDVLIDKTGKELFPVGTYNIEQKTYTSDPVSVRKKSGPDFVYGYIDHTGKVIIPIQYAMAWPFKNGYARVRDSKGDEFIIDAAGKKVYTPPKGISADVFYDGVTVYFDPVTGLKGFINKEGQKLTPAKYKYTQPFVGDYAIVTVVSSDRGFDGVINKKGQEVFPPTPDCGITIAPNGLARIAQNGKCGVIDLATGKTIVPIQYEFLGTHGIRNAEWFDGLMPKGMIRVTENATSGNEYSNILSDIGGEYGFYNTAGELIVPVGKYQYLNQFSEGKCVAVRDSKWGFIDKSGNEIITCQYDIAIPFSEGKAGVGMKAGTISDNTYRNGQPIYDWYFLSKKIDPLDSASSWAVPGIKSAIAKGFVPADIQNNYTSFITRAEFCRMAVKWLEYRAGNATVVRISQNLCHKVWIVSLAAYTLLRDGKTCIQ